MGKVTRTTTRTDGRDRYRPVVQVVHEGPNDAGAQLLDESERAVEKAKAYVEQLVAERRVRFSGD